MKRINLKLHFAAILFCTALLSTSCNDDDDNSTPTTPTGTLGQTVNGERGSSFTFNYVDGSTETITGDNVLGWEGGQLLNLNFYRQVRIPTSAGSFTFRLNMPQGSSFQEGAIASHGLSGYTLLLQDTQFLDEIVAEFFPSSTSNPLETSAFGEVTIMKDVSVLGTNYSIIGQVDAVFEEAGGNVEMTGTFWSIDGPW